MSKIVTVSEASMSLHQLIKLTTEDSKPIEITNPKTDENAILISRQKYEELTNKQ